MNKFESFIFKASKILDSLAGICVVASMALVVINILFREVLNSPILGVYDFTGFLSIAVISFAIAFCGVQKAHIAVDLIVEKLPLKIQNIVDFLTKITATAFLGFLSWNMMIYSLKILARGEMSVTSKTPLFPFTLIITTGMFMLFLLEALNTLKAILDFNTNRKAVKS